jgi:hypothetical protein
MVELYTSWCKGLAQNKEALTILKNCPFISGIETINSHKELELFQKAGLKVSIHNPIKMVNCALSNDNLGDELDKKENAYILDSIRNSDGKAVGFHAYQNTLRIEAHVRFGKPLSDSFLQDESLKQIRKNIVKNLLYLEKKVNKGLVNQKKILFETQPYVDFTKLKNPMNKVSEQQMVLVRKAGMMSSPEFILSILDDKKIKANKNIGFLFDVAHIFISVQTRIDNNELKEDVDSYISKIINDTKGRIYEMHIACPIKLTEGLYVDDQKELGTDDMSRQAWKIAKQVYQANPDILSITLEIDTHLEPVEHVKKLVQQGELVTNELSLKVEK